MNGKSADPRSCHVITSSAKTQASYQANKRKLLQWLRMNQDVKIENVAYTTTARKMHHPIRFACTASTVQELIAKLGEDPANATPARGSPVVFVFSGQGSHYAGMGNVLYATCPAFREVVNLCVNICAQHRFPPFLDIITDNDVDMSTKNTIQTQLAILTLELGLAAFWKSCGIQPSIVIGHSLGEYAALQVAGVFSTTDVLYLIGHRARLLLERCEAHTCSMLSIPTSRAAIQDTLDKTPHSTCSVACANSPSATVISGSTNDVEDFKLALASPTKTLQVPYGFHSFQMESVLNDYIALAGGITYSAPKIPVASTLLAFVVEELGVFNPHYLAQQTRQMVNFVGALEAIKTKLADPVWLEIGPSRVCGSFVQATLSPPPTKVLTSLKPGIDPWVSISTCLTNAYKDGIDIDWVAIHASFAESLTLLTLPTYSWDFKEFWINYTEKQQKDQGIAPDVVERAISTCAQYVVQKSLIPKVQVTLRARIGDPEFMALVDAHRIRGVPICPGSVFCEAGLAAVQYAIQYSGKSDVKLLNLTIRGLSLKRPLTASLVGSESDLITTVLAEKHSIDTFQVSWKILSDKISHDLGSCTITTCDTSRLEIGWERISYFARTRMNDLIKSVMSGGGHRLLPSIFYALFSPTVEYSAAFKCVKEAFISTDFGEAAAEVVLRQDPPGSRFLASPYWAESLVHLAGFLVNANPEGSVPGTTFIMDGFDGFEQAVDLQPGQSYFTYIRVCQRDRHHAVCDVYVFHSQSLVMQCSALRFHEIGNDALDRLLGKPQLGQTAQKGPRMAPKSSPPSSLEVLENKQISRQKEVEIKSSRRDDELFSDLAVFELILESISKATGTPVTDMTDDTLLHDLGKL